MPVLVAAACALANTGSLDVGMAWLLLLICILMQASVNTFNDYFDFIKGEPIRPEDNVEASDSVLVYNDVNPRSALGLAIGFFFWPWPSCSACTLFGRQAPLPRHRAYRSRHRRDVPGGAKMPLLPSRRRGEVGIVMGGLIPLAYTRHSRARSHHGALGPRPDHRRASSRMTNNTCDIEKDIEASRRTPPVLLGPRERARAP
ncbi:MAG: prenyltransferase [Adlercreutzia equolifaciens]